MFNRIKNLRAIHLYGSILLFIFSLNFSLHNKALSLGHIYSLSRLGVEEFGWFWNVSLVFIALMLYLVIRYLITNFITSTCLNILNKTMFVSLALTGMVNMRYNFHNYVAVIYFMSTTVIMFLFGI